jgi:alkylated DNA repair dioxygenase AlkB
VEVSWLVAEPVIEREQLDEHSWVEVVRGMIPDAAAVHDHLRDTLAWAQGSVFRYEKNVDMPRLNAMTAGRKAHEALDELGKWLDLHYRVRFDDGALAQYRNGRDSVGWHRDREMTWLDDTLIGVLTLGVQRPFLVRPLTGQRAAADDMRGVLDFSPAGGDLLIMGGRTQAAWLHAVPKVASPIGTRISVQYRWTSKRGRPDTNPSFYAARTFSRR